MKSTYHFSQSFSNGTSQTFICDDLRRGCDEMVKFAELTSEGLGKDLGQGLRNALETENVGTYKTSIAARQGRPAVSVTVNKTRVL